jgi:hypothetical protein
MLVAAIAVAALVIAIIGLRWRPKSSSSSGCCSKVPKMYAFTTPGTYEFVVPRSKCGGSCGCSSGRLGQIEIYGGGGGGAGAVEGDGATAGCGGGGGASIRSNVKLQPGQTIIVTVGAGGDGGLGTGTVATGAGAATNGGDSSVSGLAGPVTLMVAGGGSGAPGLSTDSLSAPNAVGVGGTAWPPTVGSGTPPTSYIALDGQNGGVNSFEDTLGGAGGACPEGGAGGLPGQYQFAAGQNAAGGDGVQFGGGGGGGSTSSGPQDGGNGASGAVIFYL